MSPNTYAWMAVISLAIAVIATVWAQMILPNIVANPRENTGEARNTMHFMTGAIATCSGFAIGSSLASDVFFLFACMVVCGLALTILAVRNEWLALEVYGERIAKQDKTIDELQGKVARLETNVSEISQRTRTG